MADPLGTITSIIDLIDRAKALYQKFKDVKDLPKAFETIAAQIDLAKSIFEKVKTDASLVSQHPKLQAAIKSCEDDAEALNAIYVLVSETKGKTWIQRHRDYVRGVIKNRVDTVEELWERIMNGAQLLGTRYGLELQSEIEKALAAIKELPDTMTSPSQDVSTNIAETNSGFQGSNSGEIQFGNRYTGDHNQNYGVGDALMALSFVQWLSVLLVQYTTYRTTCDSEKRQLAKLSQQLETIKAIHLKVDSAIMFKARTACIQHHNALTTHERVMAQINSAKLVVDLQQQSRFQYVWDSSFLSDIGGWISDPDDQYFSRSYPGRRFRRKIKRRAVGDHVWIARPVEEVDRDKHEVHKIDSSTYPNAWLKCEVTAVRLRRAINHPTETDLVVYQAKLIDEDAPDTLYNKGAWLPGRKLRDQNDRNRWSRYVDIPADLFERQLSVE